MYIVPMRWARACRSLRLRIKDALKRHDLLVALLITTVMISIGIGLGWENNKLIPINPSTNAHYLQEPGNPLSFLSNWDGPIYLSLAVHGYTNAGQANFFPLYPLAVHIVHFILPSVLWSGLLVSWLCCVGAVYFYLQCIRQLYKTAGIAERVRAVLFFVLFPTGIFLLATYTESMFALFALGAVYCALAKRWLPAALCSALATATHGNGLFVIFLVGLIMLEAHERLRRVVVQAAIGCLGLLIYMLFLFVHTHNALAFVAAQSSHSSVHVNILHILSNIGTRNGIFFLLLVAACLYWWRRRKSFTLYTLLYAGIIFLGGRGLSGMGRYALMAFPVQWMLYDYFRDKKIGYTVVLVLCSIGWAYLLLQYAGGYTGG